MNPIEFLTVAVLREAVRAVTKVTDLSDLSEAELKQVDLVLKGTARIEIRRLLDQDPDALLETLIATSITSIALKTIEEVERVRNYRSVTGAGSAAD